MDKKEIVEEYLNYLNKIPNGLQNISDNLRANNKELALSEILNFIEGISWLTQVEPVVSEQGINHDLNKKKLDSFLNLINEGLEKQDFVLVADILEYEMIPYFGEVLASK